MADWRIAVEPIGQDRYCVMLIDRQAGSLQGPDSGDDHAGYIAARLREVLQERYGVSDDDSDRCIEAADSKRNSESWRAMQAEASRAPVEREATQPKDFEVVHYEEFQPCCPQCGAQLLIEQVGAASSPDDRIFCREHGTVGTREQVTSDVAREAATNWAGDAIREEIRKSGF